MVDQDNEDILASTDSVLSAEFREMVRDLLEHLYDLPFLQQHPLAQHASVLKLASNESPTQALRHLLIRSIEEMQPPVGHMAGSQSARAYHMVYLHYVDGMTVHEASHQLGISLRQAYRDLQRGVDNIASLIWERLQAAGATPADSTALDNEVQRLLPRPETADLKHLCANAVRAISPLAAQKAVELRYDPTPEPVTVSTDRAVAQQILVHMLSGIIQHGQPAQLSITVQDAHQGAATVTVTCHDLRFRLDAGIRNDVTQQLADRLGWVIELNESVVRLLLPTTERWLLVIDDNEALVELLDRFVDGTDYRLVAAKNPREGLRLCHELRPEAVLLDVMMPEMDGWELLQRIRNNPKTADIPVIVCTVFNDSELAYSLGASRFLPKPVERARFLSVLQSLRGSD